MGLVAFGIDVRVRSFLGDVGARLDALASSRDIALVFLDASDEALLHRFSETRRPHPAASGGMLEEGIRRERERLRGVREIADRILDTSALTVHELRTALRDKRLHEYASTVNPLHNVLVDLAVDPKESEYYLGSGVLDLDQALAELKASHEEAEAAVPSEGREIYYRQVGAVERELVAAGALV